MQEKKTYLVGGAVRDKLLGRPVHDRDFVRVGYTHEEMLAEGFKPVGESFPVYLHPETGEEYALARTEKKIGKGHKGFKMFFTPDVTLEEDLSRRDLTINAMAQDLTTGDIIDPFNGQEDLKRKKLRHTTEAFMDDPLRILRLYRFLAQLGSEWIVDPYTVILCHDNRHKLEEISAERKWQEMEKALNSQNFYVYAEEMALLGEFRELADLFGVEQPPEHHPEGDAYTHTLLCLKVADTYFTDPITKFAVLCHDFGKRTTWDERGDLHGHEIAGVPLVEDFCEKFRVPNEYRDAALAVTEHHTRVHCLVGRDGNKNAKPKTIYKLLTESGCLRNPGRIQHLMDACVIDSWGRTGREGTDYPQAQILRWAYEAVKNLNTKALTADLKDKGKAGSLIGEAVRVAHIQAIRESLR